MTKIILGLFLFFIFITFMIWLSMAKIQENYIKDFITHNLEEKYNVSYSLNTTGYPNRLDTSIKNITLLSKDNFELVEIKSLLFMSLIYNRKKNIISIKTPVNIIIGNKKFVITEGMMNASVQKSNEDYANRFTFHGVKISLNLNNKTLLKIDDLIFATRAKHSYFKDNDKEFFLKLQNPIFHNYSSDEYTNFDFKFSLDQFNRIELPQPLNQSVLFTKIFNYKYGIIEVKNTNINLENHISKIPNISMN